ncbi:MAG: tellurite resistance/C4-dicarboxylate transporter family protein [Firmicutes bacterium]|nr:tellurite resistance/C4-dicarboxylate transporter family protein [Alicyclobacillaceae bacterium]MCL6496745.1 tellurite resistance/C4-dicarboxylate transporter family protein [Bacillota bacterium]
MPKVPEPRGGISREGLRTLYPGYFALVMATEIVSTALLTGTPGLSGLSTALWGIGGVAYVVLWVLYLLRAVRFGADFGRDLADPSRAFAFFTVTAASNVLAVRSLLAGWVTPALVLGAVGAATWLGLVYGLFAQFIVRETVAFGAVNGAWLIAVVAEQSVATLASALALGPGSPRALFTLVALVFWAMGVVLYLLFIGLVLDRLLFAPITASDLTPPYWINMGATAITVLAAARLLLLPHPPVLLGLLRPFVAGTALVLWAWGSWWIPLLVLLGIWKYAGGRERPTYHPAEWSIVFPLGMYATATLTFARVPGVHLLAPIGEAFVWVGLVAWAAVAGLGLGSWVARRLAPRRGPERPLAGGPTPDTHP